MRWQSNNWWRFHKILWPSQNIWTLTSSWHFKSWKGENNGKFSSRKLFHMTQNPHFRTGTRIQSIGKQRRSLPSREQTKGIHVQKLESSRQKSLFSDELLSTDKSGPAFRRFAWSKTARTGPLYSSRNWILCTCSSHVFTNPEFSTYPISLNNVWGQ